VVESRESRVESTLVLSCLLIGSCAGTDVTWSGVAIAPDVASSRESPVGGALSRAQYFESARIVLDRSFETRGFAGSPFRVEAGREHVLLMAAENVSLAIAFDGASRALRVVDDFVPHFYVDTLVPGVAEPMRYTLVCKGGTGRLRVESDGSEVSGDLAISVSCRTYAAGEERDETNIRISGSFRAKRSELSTLDSRLSTAID
jgi:hypothetical protein